MTDKEKIRRYEAVYSDIQAYIKRANADPRIGIAEMYGEIVSLLEDAFDLAPCRECVRGDGDACPDCYVVLCPDCMPNMQNHDWLGHNESPDQRRRQGCD